MKPVVETITCAIRIRALKAHDQHDGTFIFEMERERLPNDTQVLLNRLFPNVVDKVYRLLDTEALLASVVTELKE